MIKLTKNRNKFIPFQVNPNTSLLTYKKHEAVSFSNSICPGLETSLQNMAEKVLLTRLAFSFSFYLPWKY